MAKISFIHREGGDTDLHPAAPHPLPHYSFLPSHQVYTKLSVAMHHLHMPTMAAIIGQMRADIGPHLGMVDHLLRNTPLSVDSGPVYFPLIADIHLMEKMAGGFPLFGRTLVTKLMFSSL